MASVSYQIANLLEKVQKKKLISPRLELRRNNFAISKIETATFAFVVDFYVGAITYDDLLYARCFDEMHNSRDEIIWQIPSIYRFFASGGLFLRVFVGFENVENWVL